MPPQGGDHPTRQAPIGTGQFQSTPPHGRRPCAGRLVGNALHGFNPRLRTGGDGIWASMTRTPGSFNPRLRTGGDPSPPSGAAAAACFNPRLRTGGDTSSKTSSHRLSSFNPRLRTGGDGVTPRAFKRQRSVSIHASAREATTDGEHPPRVQSSFNPRLRTGGDPHHQGERC